VPTRVTRVGGHGHRHTSCGRELNEVKGKPALGSPLIVAGSAGDALTSDPGRKHLGGYWYPPDVQESDR
jgi:hypothetical protein